MPQQKQTARGPLYQQPSPLIYALHHAPVSGLSWAPDGTKLVSADEQGEIHVWDANTGISLFSCNAQVSHVTCLVWSPNGEKIAIADDEGQVALCDGANGNLMMKYNEHRAAISTLAWSPDSAKIVSSDRDTVHVWCADGSEICWETQQYMFETWPVAWSPDGSIVAISNEIQVLLMDAGTGQQVQSYDEHFDMVSALAFSPDGTRIASASDDLDIRVWERQTGKTLHVSQTYEIGMIVSLSWSADGALLAATGDEPVLSVYDASTGQKLCDYTGHAKMVNVVVWSPNSNFLATASDDHTVHVIRREDLLALHK